MKLHKEIYPKGANNYGQIMVSFRSRCCSGNATMNSNRFASTNLSPSCFPGWCTVSQINLDLERITLKSTQKLWECLNKTYDLMHEKLGMYLSIIGHLLKSPIFRKAGRFYGIFPNKKCLHCIIVILTCIAKIECHHQLN